MCGWVGGTGRRVALVVVVWVTAWLTSMTVLYAWSVFVYQMAFALLGHVIYGATVESLSTFDSSLVTLLLALFGTLLGSPPSVQCMYVCANER